MNFSTYFNSRKPLSIKEFADTFVFDNEMRVYGMISPKGNIYVCPYTEHVTLLYKLPELIQDPNYENAIANNVYEKALLLGWSRFAFYHSTDTLEIDTKESTKAKMASFYLKFTQVLKDILDVPNISIKVVIDR